MGARSGKRWLQLSDSNIALQSQRVLRSEGLVRLRGLLVCKITRSKCDSNEHRQPLRNRTCTRYVTSAPFGKRNMHMQDSDSLLILQVVVCDAPKCNIEVAPELKFPCKYYGQVFNRQHILCDKVCV